MIARIAGRLEQLTETTALIDTGVGLWYEVLIPAYSFERLSRRVGEQVVLHTIHYLDGDPSRGGQTPRLVGFPNEDDRRFLGVFTTVKGIGVRKALRALARPVGDIAAAIASEDVKFLTLLPEIGKRTAQQIVAELSDKMDPFATVTGTTVAISEMSAAAAEAVSVLIQLGEKRADAAALVDRALAVAPEADTPETIIQHVYKLKAGGT